MLDTFYTSLYYLFLLIGFLYCLLNKERNHMAPTKVYEYKTDIVHKAHYNSTTKQEDQQYRILQQH